MSWGTAASIRVALGAALLASVTGMMIRAASRANRISAANARLLTAAAEGRMDAMVAALTEGAEIDARDEYDVTPLISALRGDAPDCARFLLQRGASVTRSTKGYGNPLAWAACYGHHDLVGELLNDGADPNADSDGYYYPLRMCAMYRTESGPAIARTLIAAGADVHRVDPSGKTPADTARFVNNNAVLEVLLAHEH